MMTASRHRTACVALAATAAALAAVGCKPEPEPGTVDLVGDSIAVQANLAGSGLENHPENMNWHMGVGWQASDVLPWVEDQVANGRPETLIISLGTNDASGRNGGWTSDDYATWAELLDAPHPTACIVVALPAVGEGARQYHIDQLALARADISTLAGMREGPTVLVDWALVVDADPTVLADDGVHLAKDEDGPWGISAHAAEARISQYWQGVETCQAEADDP